MSQIPLPPAPRAIASLRAFNRFHTRFVGLLAPSFVDSGLSLVEARVLYEIATREAPVAADIVEALAIDRAQMSRIIAKFEAAGLIVRGTGSDGRLRPISLTEAGAERFVVIDASTRAAAEQGLAHLDPAGQTEVAAALDFVRALIESDEEALDIRTFAPGDMGRIMARQAAMYASDHGWGAGMEVMIGEIVTDFLRRHDPARSQCWVAELAGTLAGSVFVVDAGDGVAQLRLLYVEPWARGWGIGADLIDRCIEFARDAGYREIMLWTHARLLPARRLYEKAGFTLRSSEMHDEFGTPEMGETWALPLQP